MSRVSLVLKNLISSRMSLNNFGEFSGSNFFVDFEETHEGVLNDFNNDISDLLITSDILSSENLLFSKTKVSKFMKIRSCCLALEFISDVPLKSKYNNGNKDNKESNDQYQELYVGINYKIHGIMVLKKFSVLCTSVCPLKTGLHTQFLKSHLSHTGPSKRINLGYLYCSRPWIVYWTLHSLALLGEDICPYKERSINTLMNCWDPVFGGFGGGEGQRGHLATTYSSLCVLKMFDSLELVDSKKLYSFLMDMKIENGSFSATYGGESDSRSTYCAVASAQIMGLLTEKFTEKTAEFLQSCQTYEGGLSAEPYLEAHAGYTYCGLSAMAILGELGKLDLNKLYHWALRRLTSQLGFQGRPHKLVDSCYSFWIGGCLEILNVYSDNFFPLYNKNNNYDDYVYHGTRPFYHDTNPESLNNSNPNSNYNNNSENKLNSNYEAGSSGTGSLNVFGSGSESFYTVNNGSQEVISDQRENQTNIQDYTNDDVKYDIKENETKKKDNKENPFKICSQHAMQITMRQKGMRLYEQLLRCYLLVVSQTGKGFRDKPNKHSDLYHTCYSLSYFNIINPITNRKHDILLNLVEL